MHVEISIDLEYVVPRVFQAEDDRVFMTRERSSPIDSAHKKQQLYDTQQRIIDWNPHTRLTWLWMRHEESGQDPFKKQDDICFELALYVETNMGVAAALLNPIREERRMRDQGHRFFAQMSNVYHCRNTATS